MRFESGAVRCWGTAIEFAYSAPDAFASEVEDLDVGATVLQLSAGEVHTCALVEGGNIRCWGLGNFGALGYASTEDVGDDETPASAGDVDIGGTAVHVTAGSVHTCALLEGGHVRCWGRGDFGVLGYGSTDSIGDDETPASVGTVDVGGTVVQLDAGGFHTCALLDTGALRCWGRGDNGRLGYSTTEHIGDDETPASVGDVDVGAITQFAVGTAHTCALLDGGTVRCWGSAEDGRLGYGNLVDIGDDETPASAGDIDVGGTVTFVDAGYHTCALLDTGTLRCWGFGFTHQLGYPDGEDIGDDESPASAGDVPFAGDPIVLQPSAGLQHSCAVIEGSVVRCWGYGGVYGLLGYGDEESIPTPAEDLPL